MHIDIDVGNAEQKRLIRKELSILESAATGAGIIDQIERVAVPADFEGEVRRLTGDSEFRQNRGYHLVLAKIVAGSKGTTILISPVAFTEGFDTQIRVSWYVHELAHVDHNSRFPPRENESATEKVYSENLHILFGDYAAERCALETCAQLFDKPSDLYAELHRSTCAAFMTALDDDQAYRALAEAVVRFRLWRTDITGYQRDVRPVFDRISKSLAYAAAYIDSNTGFCEDSPTFHEARFVTHSARELASYFATKYQDADFDLADGAGLMKAFAKTFGFTYEDTDEGLYCRVVGLSI